MSIGQLEQINRSKDMADNGVTTLDSIYTSLISYQMQIESQPLTRLTKQKDNLAVQRGVYSDLKTRLDQLRSSAKMLLSSDPFYSLKSGRQISVSNVATGSTVISGSVSSAAVASSYNIENIVLAKNDQIRSDQQEYADQALSKVGTFYMGGLAERSASKKSETINTINNFGTAVLDVGQLELGSGNYSVETRKNSSEVWQFRLVNSEGNAVKIKLSDGSGYSDGWQSIATGGGTYSTGRGLSIDFGSNHLQYIAASRMNGAASVDYNAQGVAISLTSEMSLIDIATAINAGTYASGNELTATVVNKQLVINANLTGSAHKIQASGSVLEEIGLLTGSAFKNVMQSAGNATFTVNGLSVTRSQNSALSDVINGVTLNLASDAQGKSATINVTADNSAAKAAINSFITNFNSLQSYLSSKLSVSKQADGTYKRGSLSGDQTVSDLKSDLLQKFSKYDTSGGKYKALRDIGIDINDNLNAAITDNTKLEEALKSNYSEVTKLIDGVMSSIDSKLAKFTGTASYVDQMIIANDSQTKSIGDQIKSWNSRLTQRKTYLTNQYVIAQAQMTLLTYQQQTNTAWISTLSRLS